MHAILSGILYVAFAAGTWPWLDRAAATGIFRVSGKTIRRDENAGYFGFVMGLWRVTALLAGAGGLFLVVASLTGQR